jgi:carboxypeptidase T
MTHPTTPRRAWVRARGLLIVAVVASALVPLPALTQRTEAADSTALGSPTVVTEQLDGGDRYATAVAISQRLSAAGPLPVVYLVSGETYEHSLAAGPAAAHEGGAVLYTKASSLPAVTRDELIRLAPARVEVVGPASAISAGVMSAVVAALPPETVVERLAGEDPSATSAAVSARAFASAVATVYVATASDFADGIVAGPAAGIEGAPLLLTAPDAMSEAALAELSRLAPETIWVIGTPAAVSDAVLTQIGRVGPIPTRISAADRYATAVAVAAQLVPAGGAVAVTSGLDFSGGLAAVPLAAQRGAPILFTDDADLLPVATRDRLVATRPVRMILSGPIAELTRAELVGFADGRLTVQPAMTYPANEVAWHDYGELYTILRAAEIAYPTLVDLFSLGKSQEGRDIWAGKISANVSVDQGKPEVLIDALHHADERMTVEQALYMLRILTDEYHTDAQIHRLLDSRTIWIVFALNPDGWFRDVAGGVYQYWRKNRQLTGEYYGTDLNRNYPYKWACCGGSSGDPWSWKYRGTAPWSAPETSRFRDFMAGRVVDGKQRIRTHVTLHANGELVLYPYGYTKSSTTGDMTSDDREVFKAMASTRAGLNGYGYKQSSHLYVTDGDQIDWMYHEYGIFSFTMELYPVEQTSSYRNYYPPYSVVPAQTARNRGALLYLIEMAGCPYQAIDKGAEYCGDGRTPVPPPSGLLP